MHRCRWSAGESGNRKRLTVTGKIKKKEREEAMETETTGGISRIMEKQRAFFESGKTFDLAFRRAALVRLERAVAAHEKEICEALYQDLGKSETEGYMCEVGLTLGEIREMRKKLRRWSRTKRVGAGLANFPAKGYIVQEPYGVALIMSPWNYPFMLTIEPLAGAIAAGNCCVIKPSAYSPATSAVIARLIREIFPEGYVTVIEGGRKENAELLEQKFDYIFFTGSVSVGKLVMQKAAAHLTPVSLELGGKSPCIVDRTAKISLAARRIVFGKFLNCGQTCVAPDYVLVEECVKDEFLKELIRWTKKMYGSALENPDYGRIVNRKHFERIRGLIDGRRLVWGGEVKEETLQIAPVILYPVSETDACMQEEIFGPVLPVLPVKNMEEARAFVKSRPHPLACYVFTASKKTERMFLKETAFGGGCVNDTIMHLTPSGLPFGGVGSSGMGAYHGKKSFETFSHAKSVLKKSTLLDVTARYQPYTGWKRLLIRAIGNR